MCEEWSNYTAICVQLTLSCTPEATCEKPSGPSYISSAEKHGTNFTRQGQPLTHQCLTVLIQILHLWCLPPSEKSDEFALTVVLSCHHANNGHAHHTPSKETYGKQGSRNSPWAGPILIHAKPNPIAYSSITFYYFLSDLGR